MEKRHTSLIMKKIIKNIQRKLGFKTMDELAAFLGVSRNTLFVAQRESKDNPKMKRYILISKMLDLMTDKQIKKIKMDLSSLESLQS